MTDAARYEIRRENIRRRMVENGLDALLVCHAANRYYLSGFELHDPQCNESAGRLLITADGRDLLCTDARYADAAARIWDPDRICIYGASPAEEIGRLIRDRISGTVGFEARSMSLDFYEHFAPGLSLQWADGLVEELRAIKDEDEIARLSRSCRLNHALMEWLPSALSTAGSEADLAWRIEKFFREHGASELAFASVVACGVNAALPHYIPSRDVPVGENTPVLVDVGCRLDDYCSDQTRTFWVGDRPDDRFLRTLDAVRAAQDKAVAAVRPGVPACDVFAAAVKHFEDLGVREAFTHGLGHGVGLETHEAPSLSGRSRTSLEAGMVVTVEPGLYYPDWGGVRWEYMVLVTEDGCRVL